MKDKDFQSKCRDENWGREVGVPNNKSMAQKKNKKQWCTPHMETHSQNNNCVHFPYDHTLPDAGVVPLLPLRVGAQRVAGELRWRRGRLLQSHALHQRVL